MKKLFSILAAALLCFGPVAVSAEEMSKAEKPGVMASELITTMATVEAIDLDQRLVTLKGENDQTTVIHVSEQARNLDQVKVGDVVTARFYESFTIFAQPSDGSKPAAAEIAAMERAPKGDKPGIATMDTKVITATVESIDLEARTVTVKGPEGNLATLNVARETPNLENLKTGDQVVARFTRAIAISVSKPE